MPNRSRGILTSTDREFLQTVDTYYDGDNARQSRYERRRAIRRRIVSSLLDFQDIYTYLDDEQRQKIFAEPENNGADDHTQFRASIESLLGWIYLGFRRERSDFGTIFESAVTRAERDYQATKGSHVTDVEVDFDVEVTNRYEGTEQIGRALEEGDVLFARNIYKIPEIGEVPVDPEKIDTVHIIPERGQLEPEKEKQMVKNILQIQLEIDANVEIEGIVTMPEESHKSEETDNRE